LPASRFFCEHLHQNFFRACISRIHAQVPVITTGELAKTLRQQIPCGIDVAIVPAPARRAPPSPLIKPQAHTRCVRMQMRRAPPVRGELE